MTKKPWYAYNKSEDDDTSDEGQRDFHYKHLVRAGMKVCECGHIHPGNIDGGYGKPEFIHYVYDKCWMSGSCSCTKYRPTIYEAKSFNSGELMQMPAIVPQPVLDIGKKFLGALGR
jgi:hypothetical protein